MAKAIKKTQKTNKITRNSPVENFPRHTALSLEGRVSRPGCMHSDGERRGELRSPAKPPLCKGRWLPKGQAEGLCM